jgi:Cu(I)/Ag(I) efflux system periplasmic protein CusF
MKSAIVGVLVVLVVTATLDAPPAASQTPAGAAAQSAAEAPETVSLADGEVMKVDKAAGKLTLRHGPIPSLDMPKMTMVFRVKDPAMLDQVKAGDRVRFAADKIGGQYTVVGIEPAK